MHVIIDLALSWIRFFRKPSSSCSFFGFPASLEPFPATTESFWDPSCHTEDNRATQTLLLQKLQTFTDVQWGNTTIEILGVKTFERDEDVYISLILFKYHIYRLILPFRVYRIYLFKYVQIATNLECAFCIIILCW